MMTTKNIKELGTINLSKVMATNGQIETFVPIEAIGDELNELLDTLFEDFQMKHPEIESPLFAINVGYSFGGFAIDEPEFELEVIIWDENNDDIAEFYNEIKVNLSEDAAKEVKKAIWEGLGHMLFGL